MSIFLYNSGYEIFLKSLNQSFIVALTKVIRTRELNSVLFNYLNKLCCKTMQYVLSNCLWPNIPCTIYNNNNPKII